MRSYLDPCYELNSHLMAAVLDRDYKRVEEFLQKGAQASSISSNGHTAVGMSAALGEERILRLLIESCEERLPNWTFETDMACCTPEGMDELEWEDEFPGLLTEKTECCEDDEREITSLYYYYAKTLESTGSILTGLRGNNPHAKTKRKEDPHAPDETLMTPLHYAAAFGHNGCVEILLASGCNVNSVNDDGYTALHLGTKYLNITHTLLNNGANLNLKSLHLRETALHVAVRYKSTEVVKLILKTDRSCIDAVNSDDRSPLMCALRFDADEIVICLLEYGARVNLQDKKGRTALYYAVTHNKVEIVKRLLRCRARRLPEHYLLHNCVRLNLKEMVELLILHGDNLYMRDPNGLTPAMLAIECKNTDMLEFLLLMTSKVAIATEDSFYLGIELGMAVEHTDNLDDFVPLAKVLFTHTMITHQEAAKKGLDVLTPCRESICATPLAHAIQQSKLHIAAFLLKEGFDVELLCSEHNVRLLRVLIEKPGVLEFIKLLINCGFKFPCNFATYPKSRWNSYEIELNRMQTNPLALKALTRLSIRRNLVNRAFGDTTGISSKTFSTNRLESVLQYRIYELGLPTALQTYLYDFPDCKY